MSGVWHKRLYNSRAFRYRYCAHVNPHEVLRPPFVIPSEVEGSLNIFVKPLFLGRCRNSSYADASEILISLQEIIAGALEDL
jgi:hypothetical protein